MLIELFVHFARKIKTGAYIAASIRALATLLFIIIIKLASAAQSLPGFYGGIKHKK